MKLLPYPMPYCNAGTLEVLFQNITRAHDGAVESVREGNWNDESDVILD